VLISHLITNFTDDDYEVVETSAVFCNKNVISTDINTTSLWNHYVLLETGFCVQIIDHEMSKKGTKNSQN
jgi:hydrogenase maturation factor